jgi:hypothetical protein
MFCAYETVDSKCRLLCTSTGRVRRRVCFGGFVCSIHGDCEHSSDCNHRQLAAKNVEEELRATNSTMVQLLREIRLSLETDAVSRSEGTWRYTINQINTVLASVQ